MLIDSSAAREAWRAEVERTPGLERPDGVWVFEERRDIDTARPYMAKSVVIPAGLIHPVQTRQQIGEHTWGRATGGHYFVRCEGSRGFMVAFFRE